jgi:hypothetical protein
MKIEKEFLIFKRLLGQNRARPTRTVRARPAAAQLTCTHGLPGHSALALWSTSGSARQPAVRAPHPTVARLAVSGYGTSHGKVFTVSTQGARRTHLTWLGGPTHG